MSDHLFSRFESWYANRHDYARNWKKSHGRQIVGWTHDTV